MKKIVFYVIFFASVPCFARILNDPICVPAKFSPDGNSIEWMVCAVVTDDAGRFDILLSSQTVTMELGPDGALRPQDAGPFQAALRTAYAARIAEARQNYAQRALDQLKKDRASLRVPGRQIE